MKDTAGGLGWAARIEVFLFDLDGTLRENTPNSEEAFFDHAAHLGAPAEGDSRRQAIQWVHYYWAQSPELAEDRQTFKDAEDGFWTNYTLRSLKALGCSSKCAEDLAPELVRYMEEEYKPTNQIPEDVPDTLQALNKAGYRLGLLSNRNKPCDEELAELGLSHYFEMTLVAGEVDAWKPDPKIFEHALERMNTAADRAAYVGDNYYADVIGSRNAGLQPVLIDPRRIFTEADCPVIRAVGDLRPLANRRLN